MALLGRTTGEEAFCFFVTLVPAAAADAASSTGEEAFCFFVTLVPPAAADAASSTVRRLPVEDALATFPRAFLAFPLLSVETMLSRSKPPPIVRTFFPEPVG